MARPTLQQTPQPCRRLPPPTACRRQPPAATCPRLQLSKRVSPLLGLSPAGSGIALVLALLVAMTFLTDRLGGALFNPANNAFLWALGKGSAREHWVRSVSPSEAGASAHPRSSCYIWQHCSGTSTVAAAHSLSRLPCLPLQVAQAFGGVVGAVLALNLLPDDWQK
jgi:hypothetical protein